jgi:peptidoglycan/xylan/chitin deacetylase (PgdA/CDA1 family)
MKKRVSFCAAAMMVCALFLVTFGSFFTQKKKLALADETKEQAEIKTVYLTFDDGPSDKVTPLILNVLQQEGVHATFFVIGKQAETRQYLIEREVAEGHTVAVHTYSHDYHSIYASPQSLVADIEKCNDILEKITGKRSKLYRFPGGSYGLSESLIGAVTQHGMRYIDWNASTRDAEIWNPTAWQLYQSAISTSADINHIVLLSHDSPSKTTTAQALPDIIAYYKAQGYTFATF